MMELVLASRNRHKIAELRRIAPHIEWIEMPSHLSDPPETGDNFEANALQKATFVYARTGLFALADDSGIAVDALGGAPGVRSRRYSRQGTDEANNAKLLKELGDRTNRTARYWCVLAVVGQGVRRTVSGTCEGTIGYSPRGSGGFGYDPLFFPVATPGRTMAELAPAEKDAISHRGAALARIGELLHGLA